MDYVLIMKEMKALGFTPMNILLTFGIVAVALYLKSYITSDRRNRETWHKDTRKQVTTLQDTVINLTAERMMDKRRIDDCEDDRQDLHAQVKVLADYVARFESCSQTRCPFKQ